MRVLKPQNSSFSERADPFPSAWFRGAMMAAPSNPAHAAAPGVLEFLELEFGTGIPWNSGDTILNSGFGGEGGVGV